MKKTLLMLSCVLALGANDSYYERGTLVELEKIQNTRDANTGVLYYKSRSGKKIGVTDEMLVQCKVGVDCKALLASFNLIEIKTVSDTIFLVKIQASKDIFSISRELFETGHVEFAHPNFIKERKLR